MPPWFTLLQLQRTVEALAGVRLHKQNFRRLVEQQGLVEETGEHQRRDRRTPRPPRPLPPRGAARTPCARPAPARRKACRLDDERARFFLTKNAATKRARSHLGTRNGILRRITFAVLAGDTRERRSSHRKRTS